MINRGEVILYQTSNGKTQLDVKLEKKNSLANSSSNS